MRRSSMNTRSAETAPQPRRVRAGGAAVSGSGSKSSSTASRTRRSTRSGSSANAPGEAMRRRRAARSTSPPSGSRPALAAGERLGDRVDREVAQRQVVLQRAAAQRLDVDLPGAVARDHAPAAELLREREAGGPARGAGDRARGVPRAGVDHDVQVERVAPSARSRGVAADQPRRSAGQGGARGAQRLTGLTGPRRRRSGRRPDAPAQTRPPRGPAAAAVVVVATPAASRPQIGRGSRVRRRWWHARRSTRGDSPQAIS